MAQLQNPLSPSSSQAELPRLSTRKCLLKGCDRCFSPAHPLDRYCGEDCKAAARRWRLARTNLKYRGSEHGKQNRRAQAARYRFRLKEQAAAENLLPEPPRNDPSDDPAGPREGYHKDDAQEKCCCDRPGCYRRFQPKLERQMTQSLKDYGQVSPIIVCLLEGQTVLVDGFKRLRAARALKGFNHLSARLLEVDEQAAKAAVFNLNRAVGRPVELEESWIIYALVREDGLQQTEVAAMLGRHKSWVNRRLALIERLCDEARESLRLGLLTPTQARHLIRLPRGNQKAAMTAATAAALTSRELSDVVDLLSASSTSEQTDFVLAKPREALRQSQSCYVHQWDPRMSAAGTGIRKGAFVPQNEPSCVMTADQKITVWDDHWCSGVRLWRRRPTSFSTRMPATVEFLSFSSQGKIRRPK